VVLGLLFPGLAWGADVRLSLAGSVEYDDNVTRAESGKEDDAIFRVSPQIRVVEDREKLNYSVGYLMPYEVGVTSSEVNDLNHFVDANVRYRATPQTEVFGDNNFYYVRGLFSQDEDLGSPSTGQVGDDRNRVLQNNVALGATHQFTPRLRGTLLVNNGVYDTNQFARANVLSVGANANSEYQLTPNHALGGGFSYSRQMFQDTFNRPSSDTNYYNLFGSWEWLFDETTVFRLQAGPAIIDSYQEAAPSVVNSPEIPFSISNRGASVYTDVNCPTLTTKINDVDTTFTVLFDNAGNQCDQVGPTTDPATIAYLTDPVDNPEIQVPYVVGGEPTSVSDTRVTYFANASLTKRWSPNLSSSVSYARQDNGASGIDGGAVLDAITLNNIWRISERWDFGLRTDWTQRKSATDGARIFVVPGAVTTVPGITEDVLTNGQLVQVDSSDSLDTQRWGMAARLAYRLTKNTVTSLQYAYNKQSSDGDTVGQDSDFDNHLVTFTVQYNFEPIGLPW
jgi:hypothetical protein